MNLNDMGMRGAQSEDVAMLACYKYQLKPFGGLETSSHLLPALLEERVWIHAIHDSATNERHVVEDEWRCVLVLWYELSTK